MTPPGRRRLSRFFIAAILLLAATSDPRSAARQAEPRIIDVVARRFAFEPAEIQARVGEPIRLVVTSGDGVHGIEIKRFRVKKEVPRDGDPVVIDFTPGAAGRFPILCSEYCGKGHEDMQGMLVVAAGDTNN